MYSKNSREKSLNDFERQEFVRSSERNIEKKQVKIQRRQPDPKVPGFLAVHFGSTSFLVSLSLYAIIAIFQFVVGLVYIGQCPVQKLIPVYMIVSGACGLALVIVGILIFLSLSTRSACVLISILVPIYILLLLFAVIWFFMGNVWVFEVKLKVAFFDPELIEYCHGLLYKFAFFLIITTYVYTILAILLSVTAGGKGKK
ncbi:unnamed protein product [Didymodactylos carnosus]|uniref:Uncharacterized protein n=1 Tax=Didymodactylos carnosus TaxID=1234261 RepID=A0A8S2SIN0_9BILA|nr:unnamed protein product [Didymodactylos carnosus]CAF4228295.1 unnamed protein product [Didymodactylos carnosus]